MSSCSQNEYLFSVSTCKNISIYKIPIVNEECRELYNLKRPEFIQENSVPSVHLVNAQGDFYDQIYITWGNFLIKVKFSYIEEKYSFVEEGYLKFEHNLAHFGQLTEDIFCVFDSKSSLFLIKRDEFNQYSNFYTRTKKNYWPASTNSL